MSMTKTSAVMGSPLYMSPEQMQSSRNVDARADIWAIGVILYELATGKVPFHGESLPELVVKVLTTEPSPLRNFRPEAPAGLEQVIFKCLAKDRAKRYLNVAELALALLEYAPKQSRASVAKISRIIQASGLSASALALPPPVVVPLPSAEPAASSKEPLRAQPHSLKKPSTLANVAPAAPAASNAAPPPRLATKPPRAATPASPADDIGRFLTDPK
jgi:serine/threonine protein kinase